jgi:hypothetical protein
VDKPEVARLSLPCSTVNRINQRNLEECVVVVFVVIRRPSGELLVGRHQRRRDIVCKKVGVSVDVKELYNITVADNTPPASFRDGLGRDNSPKVVGIVMGVTSDLLAYTESAAGRTDEH